MKFDCVFCKIISQKNTSTKIWEDNNFVAILDINPNIKGMTLIITKHHYDSDIFDLPEEIYNSLMRATRRVAYLLIQGLGVERVAVVAEGMGINHAHTKLYPLHGLSKKFEETWAKKRVYFKRYAGYLSTQLGPPAAINDLAALASQIKKRSRK